MILINRIWWIVMKSSLDKECVLAYIVKLRVLLRYNEIEEKDNIIEYSFIYLHTMLGRCIYSWQIRQWATTQVIICDAQYERRTLSFYSMAANFKLPDINWWMMYDVVLNIFVYAHVIPLCMILIWKRENNIHYGPVDFNGNIFCVYYMLIYLDYSAFCQGSVIIQPPWLA